MSIFLKLDILFCLRIRQTNMLSSRFMSQNKVFYIFSHEMSKYVTPYMYLALPSYGDRKEELLYM